MARKVITVTPENVRIEYELAGLASRGGAAIVDTLVQALIILVVLGIRLLLINYGKWPGTTWADAVLVIAMFVVWYGYFVYFETVWSGQTPGKRHGRLRAVREGGLPMNFTSAAVRNLVRTVDFLPIMYILGAIVILCSGSNKRLGDIAAGTLVVKERGEWMPESAAAPAPEGTEDSPRVKNIELITPDEFDAAKRFVERMPELEEKLRIELAARIAGPIMHRLGVEDDGHIDHCKLLEDIHNDCVQFRGMR